MVSFTLSFLTRVIFPAQCHHCSTLLSPVEQSLCQICIASLPRPTIINSLKLKKLGVSIGVQFSTALTFDHPVQLLCYKLKYGGNYPLGQDLGQHILAPHLLERTKAQSILLCPIPIHPRRLRRRGYNQSLALARGCALGLKAGGRNATVVELLEKSGERQSQIEFDQYTRWGNASGAFRPKKNQRAPGGALVVLVDDTVTTGASLLSAAEALLQWDPKLDLYLLALAQES